MKYLAVFFSLFIYGCGDDGAYPCIDHVLFGVWRNNEIHDVLGMQAGCDGTSFYCSSGFTWSGIDDRHVSLNVTSTATKAGCPAIGTHTCTFAVTNKDLVFDCGSGAISYTKAD